jgi:hypothetical protein
MNKPQLGGRSKKRMRNIFVFSLFLLVGILIFSSVRPLYKFKMQSDDSFAFKVLAVAASSYDAILIALNSFGVVFDAVDIVHVSTVPKIELQVEEGSINKMASNLPDSAKEKYYKAKLLYPDGVWRKIKYRFRGRSIYHWDPKKPSLRLKLSKDYPIGQLRHINLVNPEDRAMISNYFGEYLADKIGVMTHNTKFVRVFINNKYVGLYHHTTREDEEMIRVNDRFPGPLFIGDDLSEVWDAKDFEISGDKDILENFNPIKKMVNAINSDSSVEQYKNLWSILDMDKYAKFNALLSLAGGVHTDYTHNHLYYFDPTSGLLEPIISDINGHGLQLYPSPLTRLFEPNKPNIKVPLNGQNNPLLDVALRDPIFRHLRNKHLYNFLNNQGSYTQQKKKLDEIFDYIDSAVLADKEKASIKETFVGWFRVPYSNSLYKESKDVLYDWIERRNMFLEKELNNVDISVDFYRKDKINKMLVTVSGNSAVAFDTSLLAKEVFSIYPNKEKIMIGGNLILHPGISHSDASWRHSGKKVYDYDIVGDKQVYEFTLSQLNSNFQKSLLLAFSNAVSDKRITPKVTMGVYTENNSIKYTSKDIHPWLFSQKNDKNIILGPGEISLSEDLLISKKQSLTILPGTTVNMKEGVSIISKGRVIINGTQKQPILIRNKENNRWGVLAIIGSDSENSSIEYTTISGGSLKTAENIKFSGMVSVHWSNGFMLKNSNISDNLLSDDTLHIVHSDFSIQNTHFNQCFADCIDLDYTNGSIKDVIISNPGNDGIDLMRSYVSIQNSSINMAIDKGVSVGEMSKAVINNITINNSNIGIAVKDLSSADISSSTINNNKYGLSIYKKNWRFGSPGSVTLKHSIFNNNRIDVDIQEEGELSYDSKTSLDVIIGDGFVQKTQD